MRYCSSKDIDSTIRKLVREGWAFSRGKRHGRLTPPNGGWTLTVATSPSDWRAFIKFQRDVRQAQSGM